MITFTELDKIWEQITPEDWLGLITEFSPTGEWEIKNGNLHGCCPVHDDASPSAWIMPGKKFFKCFGCNEYFRDPIALFSNFGEISYMEAFHALRQRFGLKGINSKLTQALQERERLQRVKAALARAFQRELIMASQDMENATYVRAVRTVKWLKARGVDDCYHMLPIGVIPTIKRLRELIGDPDIADDCVDYFSKYLKVEFLGSLVFIYHETPNTVGRFRIRIPETKKIYAVKDPLGTPGFFGLGMQIYKPLIHSDNTNEVMAVEGEFDQLAFAVNQCKTGIAEIPVIALGGSELSNLDPLKSFGFDLVRLLADAPAYSGDTIIKQVLKKTSALQLKVFQWPPTVMTKDPDEAINVKYGYEASKEEFLRKEHYKPAHMWVFSKAVQELEDVEDNDVRRRDGIIQEWGGILLDEGERVAFLTALAKDQNIPYNQVAKKVLSADDDEMRFVARLEQAIMDVYEILGEESTGSTSYLYVWNKRKKLMRKLALARLAEVEMELGKDVGILTSWVISVVGEPDFLKTKAIGGAKRKDVGLLEKENLIRSYVQLAFKNILSQAGNYKHLRVKGQGLHWLTENGIPQMVVVNGRDAYLATYEDGKVTWGTLDGPGCGKYLLDLDDRYRWSDSINSIEDLQKSESLDGKKLYEQLVDILSTGWSFSEQKLEPEFLAAQTLAAPISTALRRQVYIFVTAEASSGKTRLTLGYFGGTQFPSINVLEHSIGMDDYTEAGFRQDMNTKSLMCCLDEFEDDGSKNAKSYEVRKILKVLRNIMGASNRILKGTPSGETKVFYLRFPVIMSAISTMREPADISRMITINMVTERGRVDPIISIGEKYDEEQMATIRANVSIAMIAKMPELLKNYAHVEKQYARGAGLPAGTQTRFREGIYPALAVMKTLGLDYEDFAYKFCENKSHYISKISSATENDGILTAVLNSPGVSAKIEGRVSSNASVGELLRHVDSRNLLNTTGCGVYYTERKEEHWLIVNWTQAIQGVLSQHPKYRTETSPNHLKEMADRSGRIVSRDKVRRSGIIRRLTGKATRLDDVTVYNISDLMEDEVVVTAEPQSEVVEFSV